MSASPFTAILAGGLERRTASYDLRPIGVDDAEDMFQQLSDPAVIEFMDIERPADVEDVQGIINWTQEIRAAGSGFRWAIRALSDGVLVGTCGLHNLEWERGSRGEIGYDIGRPYWGRRVMAEVLPVALEFGFQGLGLRRIEAMVTSGNDPSCRLLERHGFDREGVLRDYARWKGRFWDQIIYARLAGHAD